MNMDLHNGFNFSSFRIIPQVQTWLISKIHVMLFTRINNIVYIYAQGELIVKTQWNTRSMRWILESNKAVAFKQNSSDLQSTKIFFHIYFAFFISFRFIFCDNNKHFDFTSIKYTQHYYIASYAWLFEFYINIYVELVFLAYVRLLNSIVATKKQSKLRHLNRYNCYTYINYMLMFYYKFRFSS